ncbi:MAG: hypothetical protein LPK13_14360, partial [Marinobacter sp.]|nr:hypothetical protein [Marinobacter sp.]
AFWRDFKERITGLPGDLDQRLLLWRTKYPSSHDTRVMSGNVFGYESLIAILSGMDWFRGAVSPYVPVGQAGLQEYLRKRLVQYEQQVSAFPSHEDYLRQHGVALWA